MRVILVHGLWHEPRHFAVVEAGLRRVGVEVAVPMLHQGSLRADTEVVQQVVDAMPTPPVVLGHSYGGCVITGLTGIARLVYLAAFVPTETESAASLGGPSHLLDKVVVRRPDGGTELDPVTVIDAMYADCDAEVAARAVSLLRPQARGHAGGRPSHTAWRTVPSTYVVCSADRAVDPDVQREMASRCTTTQIWPAGHSPYLSRPQQVVDLLTDLTATT